jgi:GT2 family glycosyltransferase
MSALERDSAPRPLSLDARPRAGGKFLFAGDEKIYVRGVTYGAFRPDGDGNEFHDLDLVDRDFAQMAANGMNAVRIPHTTPPRALLDVAQRHGLRVMVGLSVEQYVGFLIDRKREEAPDIAETLRAKVRSCAGHPALLCYALGNEVPASLVRWLGRRRVERFLERMHRIVKQEDPEGLVTYVNYPTTEYLELPFLDLLCFNVYLESQETLEAYLARLQNIAGDRPLIMSELGLDAMRNGELTQAKVLDWQVRTSFAAGCAGVFIFSWTDEWFRGGADVDDWEFGLTDRERRAKPALAAVRQAFDAGVFASDEPRPRISVVVCSHNGSRTIRDCCEGLVNLEYPDFEVIVVNDGSSDGTAAVASEYGFRVISTENRGLSSARNTGLAAATGEIVAYIDDDAYPDPHWLTYLAATFASSNHVGVGGPNVTPPGDGTIAACVANAPGNPTHVLLTDEVAEHLPGCNMAFRKTALEAIGGFDPQFRAAGDDVDVCWRLRDSGCSLGFSPAAMVWHHRRNSVLGYVKQQAGYGNAEGLLEAKWRDRHGVPGRRHFEGRIYGTGLPAALLRRPLVYHGIWGNAPFQSIYERAPNGLLALTLMPEFYLLVCVLAGLSALGALWPPLLLTLPLLALSVAALFVQAAAGAARASFPSEPRSGWERLERLGLTTCLHLLQPVVRGWGRLRAGLAPRRWWWTRGFTLPRVRTGWVWSETWRPLEQRLESLEAALREQGVCVARGGIYDAWDLELRGGLLGSVRACLAVEDHGGGSQMVRFRMWPRVRPAALGLTALLAALAGLAALDGAWAAAGILAAAGSGLALAALGACGSATASYLRALEESGSADEVTGP